MTKKIFSLALPAIIANITVPLLGMADTAIMGHLNDSSYIGGIALGSMAFSLIYWMFGFLRMGTTAISAQAFGAKDKSETILSLFRPISLALSISLILILLRTPIEKLIFFLINSDVEQTISYASQYFRIRIWDAPAVLCSYVFIGWFTAIQRISYVMYCAIIQNIINILLSYILVYKFNMNIAGAAIGTLVAQYLGILIFISLSIKHIDIHNLIAIKQNLFNKNSFIRLLVVNKNLFLRTICLIAVTSSFTIIGSYFGDNILAVNTLLCQFITIFSYFTDGFAHASEALVGNYLGEKNRELINTTIKTTFKVCFFITILFSIAYSFFSSPILNLFTNNIALLSNTKPYIAYLPLIPICAVAAYIWDGVYIGLIATREMLLSCFIGMITYAFIFIVLNPLIANHALWVAFLAFLVARGIVLSILYKKTLSKSLSI